VILFAEPPLQAEIMIRSSMMVSLILGLPDCTTNTSFSRTLVRIRTLVSPCETCRLASVPDKRVRRGCGRTEGR
jgi:hypothetical protein